MITNHRCGAIEHGRSEVDAEHVSVSTESVRCGEQNRASTGGNVQDGVTRLDSDELDDTSGEVFEMTWSHRVISGCYL